MITYSSTYSYTKYPLYTELSAQDAENQDGGISLTEDAMIDQGPSAWENVVSVYDKTVAKANEAVSKAQTTVQDIVNYVKTGGGAGIKRTPDKASKKKNEDVDNQPEKEVKAENDASVMRRHERVLELLHAGSEMGYSIAMVCGSHGIWVWRVVLICNS